MKRHWTACCSHSSGLFSSLVVLAAVAAPAAAQSIHGFRSDGSGIYANCHPPLNWSKTKNIVWSTPLPQSNSLPALAEDRLFVAAEPTKLFCLRKSDGKVLWQRDCSYQSLHSAEQWARIEKELNKTKDLRKQQGKLKKQFNKLRRQLKKKADKKIEAEMERLTKKIEHLQALEKKESPLAAKWSKPRTHTRLNGYSTPTPVTDGKYVWALLGNGVAACYDKNGKRLWSKLIDRPTGNFGHSASPLLVDGKLIVLVNELQALDAKTGKLVWSAKTGRSFGTPLLIQIAGKQVILTPHGTIVDAASGKIIAKGRRIRLRYASPVVTGGRAYFVDSVSRAAALPATTKSDQKIEELWSQRIVSDRYFSSPIVHKGLIYTVSYKRVMSVMSADKGEMVYQKELNVGKASVFSTITLAGDHLFVCSSNGTTLVLKTGRNYQEVARNDLAPTRSTPVFEGNRMYLRTNTDLYCIGVK